MLRLHRSKHTIFHTAYAACDSDHANLQPGQIPCQDRQFVVDAGPYTIRDAFKGFTLEVGPLQDAWAGRWTVNNTRFQVYPLGQWFEPCEWNDYKCHADIHDLQVGDLPANLVGHHINAGVWLKESQQHNRKLRGEWLLASSVVCSCGVLCWKMRRSTKAPQSVSSPHLI